MVTVDEIRQAQKAEGPATVLAIGTATPPNCVDQSTYPDYYFRITNSEHKTELKEKFQCMCKISISYHIFLCYVLVLCCFVLLLTVTLSMCKTVKTILHIIFQVISQ